MTSTSDPKDLRPLWGKGIIEATMRCLTGLHIGASRVSLDIGGIDAPVVRDPITREPYVPGSSLKGKLRSLFERSSASSQNNGNFYRTFPGTIPIHRHECASRSEVVNNKCPICRLYGATGSEAHPGENFPARLTVRDLRLTRNQGTAPEASGSPPDLDARLLADSKGVLEGLDTDLPFTEWKSENSLDRITSGANPRQMERVPVGTCFRAKFIYDVEAVQQVCEDLENLCFCLCLLTEDSLGGHGSRGYGEVEFRDFNVELKNLGFYRGEESAANEIFTGGELSKLKEVLKNKRDEIE